MRILVVSYSFAPLNVISAQRINALTEYLSRLGHEVEVLTSVKGPVDGPLDGGAARSRLGSLAVVHEVPFLGRKANGGDREAVTRLDSSGRLFAKRWKARLGWLFGGLFDYRTVWAFAAIRHYRRHLSATPYDVVITSSGPPAVNVVGWALARKEPALRWHADFRDMWSLLHTAQVSAFTRWFECILERKLLTRASVITTVSEDLARQMGVLHGQSRVFVVRNGFDPEEMKQVMPDSSFFESGGFAGKMNLVYAGSIYPGRRDPTPLLKAIVRAGLQQDFAIHFFGAHMENLSELAKAQGAQGFCHFHGALPRSRVLGIQKAAQINLFLESGEDDARGVLTGKLFELAAIGRPVLAIGPKSDFESVDLLRRAGLLIHWESVGMPSELSALSVGLRPDDAFIQTLSRSAQFASWPLHQAGKVDDIAASSRVSA